MIIAIKDQLQIFEFDQIQSLISNWNLGKSRMDSLQPYLQYFPTFQNLQGYDYMQEYPLPKPMHQESLMSTPIKKENHRQTQGTTSKVTPKLLKITAKDLSNAIIFTQLFSRIQQMPCIQINHKPQTFMHCFSNFKTLYRSVEKFWQQKLNRELECQEIDFVQIAKNHKQEQLLKVCELFMRTAVLSKNYQYFIERILNTKQETQHIFHKIVEQTIGARSADSPRKAKQKRLYDKLMQLQNENEKLQQVVSQICDEKLQAENKHVYLLDQISRKDKQIEKINGILSQYTSQTPNKGRPSFGIEQRNSQQVQRLKNKMVQLVKQHEKQMSSMKQKVQFFSTKMQKLHELQTTIEQNAQRIRDANNVLNNFETMQNTIRRNTSTIKEKDVQINELQGNLQKLKQKLAALQQREIEQRLDLQRKTVQLQQSLKWSSIKKNSQQQDSSSFQGFTTLTKTLSQQCPQIANSHAQAVHQMNRLLRSQLDRANKTIVNLQRQAESHRKEYENYRNLQRQNKRLVYILKDLSQHRGQQNQIIMGCLYQLRMTAGLSLNHKDAMKQTRNSYINANLHELSRMPVKN